MGRQDRRLPRSALQIHGPDRGTSLPKLQRRQPKPQPGRGRPPGRTLPPPHRRDTPQLVVDGERPRRSRRGGTRLSRSAARFDRLRVRRKAEKTPAYSVRNALRIRDDYQASAGGKLEGKDSENEPDRTPSDHDGFARRGSSRRKWRGPVLKSHINNRRHRFYAGVSALTMAADLSRVVISFNTLRRRVSDFRVRRWILDSGAFTEITRFGDHRSDAEEYARAVERWGRCGTMEAAVIQDWPCEPFALKRSGLSIDEHIRRTVDSFRSLRHLVTGRYLMPVIQGWEAGDYLRCLRLYGGDLAEGAWVGVGSVCRRNGNPQSLIDIVSLINAERPDLRLHLFGVKLTAAAAVRDRIESCDSAAWSFRRRKASAEDARRYSHRTELGLNPYANNGGPGRGQGRRSQWSGPTVAVRIPAKLKDQVLRYAKRLDAGG